MVRINVVLLGRLIGAATIVVGIILSIWSSADMNYGLGGAEWYIRTFVSQVLGLLASGSLIYLAAEILDQVTLQRMGQPEESTQTRLEHSASLGGKGD